MHMRNIPSRTGFDCRSCSFTWLTSAPLPHTAATYDMTSLLASVREEQNKSALSIGNWSYGHLET